MKILVTGGGGYIGCVLVDLLIERGHEVRVLDRLYWGRKPLERHEQCLQLLGCRQAPAEAQTGVRLLTDQHGA